MEAARDLPPLPGPNRPGLIEAQAFPGRSTATPDLPGPNRPGLIEASSPARPCRTRASPFRGLIAPASLKQNRLYDYVLWLAAPS